MTEGFNSLLIEKEITAAYRQYQELYFIRRDLEAVKTLFSEDVTNFGSGRDETALNFEETVKVFTRDREQCPEPISYQEKFMKVIPISSHSGMIISEMDIQTVIGSLPVELTGYRLSVVFTKKNGSWKICHLHFSRGESELEEGESFPLQQMEKRNLALEEKLGRKDRELQNFFDSAIDLMGVADHNGKFLRLNGEWEKVLGYPVRELMGKHFMDFVHPEDIPATRMAIKKIQKEGFLSDFTNRYRCINGQYCWIEWRAVPSGNYIYVSARDISRKIQNQQNMEKLVEITEEFFQFTHQTMDHQRIVDYFREIAGASYAALNLYSDDQHTFSTVALSGKPGAIEKAGKILGFSLKGKKWGMDVEREKKLKGKVIAKFRRLEELSGKVIPAPLARLVQQTFGIGECGVARIIHNRQIAGDFTFFMPKGISFKNHGFVEIFIRQVGLLMLRSRSEKALLESESRFRDLFNNASMGILQVTGQGKIINANKALASIFGYSSSKELTQCHTFLDEEFSHFNELKEQMKRHREKEDHFQNLEIRARKKTGQHLWLDTHIRKTAIKGNRNFLLEIFCLDITEKKKARDIQREIEVTRKASETKDLFLANMSHEIRTPVTGIMGMAEVLLNTPLNEQQKEHLSIISESSRILLGVINDILDISKIEARKIELHPELFNIEKTFSNIRNLFQPDASKQNLELLLDLKNDFPLWVVADRNRIEQVLMNLLSNALKFTEKGCICISLTGEEKNREAFFRVEVKDTGIGISSKDQVLLFQKFSQVDSSLSRSAGGSGLGLYICKELIHLMDGEIGVKSCPGQGSTFWFTFKAELPNTSPRHEPSVHFSLNNRLKPFDIDVLLVDDKFVNQKVISLMLESSGCRVEVCSGGKEALAKFSPGKHRIVFMDIMMPGMDGITAMNCLRQEFGNEVPVIALTANAMEGDAEKYLAKGFNDYLAKPVTRKELEEKIRKWVKN